MYLFCNRTILPLELKFLYIQILIKNRIPKENQNLNLLPSCQIDPLSFYYPIQLNKMKKPKTVSSPENLIEKFLDKKLEVKSDWTNIQDK